MPSDLELTIVLRRAGGPGAEWSATVDDGVPTSGNLVAFGPSSSPGEVLEEVGQSLDAGEAEAIVNARRDEPDVELEDGGGEP